MENSNTSAKISIFQRYFTTVKYCFIVSFAVTSYGFDQSTLGGFLAMPRWLEDFGYYDTTEKQYAITAGSTTCMYGLTVGFAFIASALSGPIGTRYGRKAGLILCAVTNIIGSGIQMIPHYGALLVGKAIGGMPIGFSGAFAITYWSEATPVELRGMAVIFYYFALHVAAFIGSCVNEGTNAWTTRWSYRLPLLVTMVFPILTLVFIWFVPESPRWLITRERIDEAKKSIRQIRGPHIPQQELDDEIAESVAFTHLEKELEGSTSYIECFRGIDLRRTLIVAIAMSGQQFMGSGFIAGYATYFFKLVGFTDAFIVTVVVNACEIGGSLLAFPTVRYIGRRPLLIWGAGVNSFCMLAFAIIAQADPNSGAADKCLIAFICIFCFSFALTWGSVVHITLGEVPSNRLRSKTVAIGFCFDWLVALAVTTSVPYLINTEYANLGTKVGFIFGSLGVAVTTFSILCIPETKDRTLEQIDEMFLNRVPTRKFKTYTCTGHAAGYDVRHIDDKAAVTEIETIKV